MLIGNGMERLTTPRTLQVFTSLRLFASIVVAAALLGSSFNLNAQCTRTTTPTASGHALWLGGEYSNFSSSFGPPDRLYGIGAYVAFGWNQCFGLEGQLRFLRFNGFYGDFQNNYFVGPTYQLLQIGSFRVYSKLLVGDASMHYPFKIGNGSYWAVAPGAGIEFRISRRLAARADYEYQFWPAAPGIQGEPSSGLSPTGFSLGLAYKPFDGLSHRHR